MQRGRMIPVECERSIVLLLRAGVNPVDVARRMGICATTAYLLAKTGIRFRPGRCPLCGAAIQRGPCRACRVRQKLLARGPKPQPEPTEELGLDLLPEHFARYLDVRPAAVRRHLVGHPAEEEERV